MDVQMQEWQILHWLQELLPASFDEITRLSRSSPSPIKSNTPASPSLAARNRLHAAPASGYDLCDLGELLRDGTVLCELVNQLRPGSIKHYTHRESPLSKVPFKMMENIYLFLQECKKIIPQQMGEFLFEPLDLVQKRMGNVYTTLLALRKAIDNPEGSGSGRKRSLTTGSSGSIPAVELAASSTENDNREQGAHARLTVAALADSCVQDQGALQAPRTPTTKKHVDSPRVPATPTRKSVVWLSVDSRSRSPSPSTSFDGRRSDEDDDEDWETDPDYVNPTVPPVRLAVVEEPIPPKRANANPGAAVFGVKRGGCQKKRCPCPAYVQEEAKEGGPCLNCGHYPTKHSDMGRETLVDRFGHSYKNWLLPYKDIKFEFKIGDGAYGTVWRAKLWGKHVAVKQLKFELISDHVLDEFKREVEILCSLRHPNIVLFMGAVIEEGRLCIVTEILSNGSLADVIGSTHLEWSRCIGLASDACLGMNYLHQMGLIHRDLKSSNLLVDSNWTVKVADFGLSQYKGNNVVDSMAGTPGYIAPEVINGEPCTTKADVYAMGIILWELLTGRYPYAGYSGSLAIAVSVTNADRPPIPEDCPPDYRLLIEDCWHQNPHKRPTFEQILFRLRKIGNAARQSAYMRTPTKHKGATAMAIGRNSL